MSVISLEAKGVCVSGERRRKVSFPSRYNESSREGAENLCFRVTSRIIKGSPRLRQGARRIDLSALYRTTTVEMLLNSRRFRRSARGTLSVLKKKKKINEKKHPPG